MMPIDQSDLRINHYRDSSVMWHGRGTITHLPTGFVEEYEDAWNDRKQRDKAMKALEKRIMASMAEHNANT